MKKQKSQAAGTAAQGFGLDNCEEDVAKQPSKRSIQVKILPIHFK
jgi:hypothetical protein